MVRQNTGTALLHCFALIVPTWARRKYQHRLRTGDIWYGLKASSCWHLGHGHDKTQIIQYRSPDYYRILIFPALHLLPQDHSKLLRLLLLYQDSLSMVQIPNVALLRRRNISRFSCSACFRYFTTRKSSRSHSLSPRSGWEAARVRATPNRCLPKEWCGYCD